MAAADDVCDSWEDMDEIGLDRKLESFLAATPKEVSRNPENMSNNSVRVVLENSGSLDAQMMTQHKPAVKILRRPVVGNGENNAMGENKIRPMKTYEQRQQEYEQARLRILGEAKSPEDVADEMLSKLQLKPTVPAEKMKPSIEILTKTSNIFVSCDSSNYAPHQGKTLVTSQPPNLVTILRTPRIPDGTRGFLLRR